MSKFVSRVAYLAAAIYPGSLAVTHRGQLWDALKTAMGLTDIDRTTVTASAALTVTQCGTLQVDATAGNIVLTLPASGVATDEALYEIDRLDATANTVTIAAAGTDTIGGAASVTLSGTMRLRLPAGKTEWRVHSISGGTPVLARRALGVPPRAARIDVASVAGTVNLTTAAPDTDDIRITGALAITKFTVALGRVIRVTAGGAFSLANNANIVTQTGGTATFAAGDTFTLRATAVDMVELLHAVPDGAINAAKLATAVLPLGVGQTWQDVTASRAKLVTYTNSTGRPIFVHIGYLSGATNNVSGLYATVGGVILGPFNAGTSGTTAATADFLVPAGQTYLIQDNSSGACTITNWLELRA